MKMTKKWTALVLAVLLALSVTALAACDGDDPTPDTQPVDEQQVLDGSAITKNPTAYVTLGQYKGFTVPAYDTTVTDEEVQIAFAAMLNDPQSYPEEWLEAYGEAETYEDFLAYLKGEMVAQKQDEATLSYRLGALEQILADATFTEKIQPEIDAYVKEIVDQYRERAGSEPLPTFVERMEGRPYEEFYAELVADAEKNIKYQALIYAIAEAEEMELTNAIYQKHLERYAKHYNMATWEFEEALTKDVMQQFAFRDMVYDFIVENTVVDG